MTKTNPDMKIPLEPAAGRVLLVRKAVPKCFPGTSIEIPENVRAEMERTNFRATVVAIGPEEVLESGAVLTFPFVVGDELFIDHYAGYSVPLYGTDMTMSLVRFNEPMGKWVVSEEEFIAPAAEESKPEESRIITLS